MTLPVTDNELICVMDNYAFITALKEYRDIWINGWWQRNDDFNTFIISHFPSIRKIETVHHDITNCSRIILFKSPEDKLLFTLRYI